VTTPTDQNADWTFTSVEEFREMITTRDWAYAALTVPGADGEPVETGFRLLICPYCWSTVPDAEPLKAKDNHVEHHCYELTLSVIGSAGIGLGLSLTKADAALWAETTEVMGKFLGGAKAPDA
jgi:hypothetical protein